jgi:hypothetical protein
MIKRLEEVSNVIFAGVMASESAVYINVELSTPPRCQLFVLCIPNTKMNTVSHAPDDSLRIQGARILSTVFGGSDRPTPSFSHKVTEVDFGWVCLFRKGEIVAAAPRREWIRKPC